MSTKNEGKKFEEDFKKSRPNGWFLYRLKDSAGSWSNTEESRFTPKNICDFFLFNGNQLFGLELKSFKGKSIPFNSINPNQIDGLYKMSKYENAIGLFILNFRDIDKTFILYAADVLDYKDNSGRKSIPLLYAEEVGVLLPQTKKISRWRYDIESGLGFFLG